MRKIRNPEYELPLPGFEVFHDEFLATRRKEIIIVLNALQTLNFKVIADHAHRWRGFAAPYGFQELETNSIKLEEFALNADIEKCRELVEEIDAYLGH